MTKFKSLHMLAMKTENNDNDFQENFKGLLEGHNLVQGWDDSDEDDVEDEEEDEAIVALKQEKPHFLDRKDRILFGGYLRHLFYKQTKGKKPFVLTNASTSDSEELSCRCCEKTYSSKIDGDDASKSVQFAHFYTKEKDAQNRDLSDTALSLLQFFDWTATCACGEVYYGNVKLETETVSFSEKVHKMTEKTATLVATAFSGSETPSPENGKGKKLYQMNLFDFLEDSSGV